MKRFTMFIKIGFIGLSLAVLSGIVPINQERGVSAQATSCKSTACVDHGTIFQDCRCSNNECNGCFIQNGTTGCGVCSKGENESD